MTLFRQLLLLLSLLFLLLFGGNFIISMQQIWDYLQTEALIHARNTANALALSLAPYLDNPEDPLLETTLQAVYDTGYYREIRLLDANGKTLAAAHHPRPFAEAPAWLSRWLPLDTVTVRSEIGAQWLPGAALLVSMDADHAYSQLRQQLEAILWYSLGAFSLAVLCLATILRVTLRPLRTLERLATAIADGQFARIDPLPRTREIAQVARAMNRMSGHIEQLVAHLNHKLGILDERLQRDPVTELYGAARLAVDLKQWFVTERPGCVLALCLDALSELATRLGPAGTDEFLRALATRLQEMARAYHAEAAVYRRQNSEFVLLLPDVTVEEARAFATTLAERLAELGRSWGREDVGHLGIAPCEPLSTPADTLAAATAACAQARLVGPNALALSHDPTYSYYVSDWRAFLTRVIEGGEYQLSYLGAVYDLQNGTLLMAETFTQVWDDRGQPIPIGVFVGMAEKCGLVNQLDRGVTQRAFTHLAESHGTPAVLINLSLLTLASAEFRYWLGALLREHHALAPQSFFSVTAYSAARDPLLVREFAAFVRAHGARFLLKRYEPRFIPSETLKVLQPDAIRLAHALTVGIADDEHQRALVEALVELGTLFGITVFAERVTRAADLAVLRELGVVGASR